MYALVVTSGDEKGKTIPVSSDFMTIGRSSKCDIVCTDKSVSRRHVEILMTDGQLYVRDSGSSNGTFINNVQIKEPKVLKINDFIRLGALIMQLVESKGTHSEITTEVCDEDEDPDKIKVDQIPITLEHEKAVVSAGSGSGEKIDLEAVSFEQFKDPFKCLNILYQVSEVIREISDVKELLDKIMDLLYHLLKFENGFIMLKDEETGKLIPKIVKKKTPEGHKINISRALLDKVKNERVSILIEDAATDNRFKEENGNAGPRFKSAMCAPLICKDEFLGIIYIDTVESYLFYGKEELNLLNGIANQSATAIALAKSRSRMKENLQMERDQELARELHKNYLPKKLPPIPKFDISSFSLPAPHVGGDYYDIIRIDDTKFAFIMADVSGKGLPAVFLINTIRLAVHIEMEHGIPDIADMLTKIDKRIFIDGNQQMFATVLFGILDTEKKIFSYINAGQCSPVLFKPNGEIISLQSSHKLLGFSEPLKCSTEKIFMPRGGIILFYTDGLPDLKNDTKEFFGENRIKEIIGRASNYSAREITEAYEKEIAGFKKDSYQQDDISMFVLKCVQ